MMSAYKDRFEGEVAVILLGDDMKQAKFPKSYLPADVSEGDYITISIAYDKETAEQAEKEALELLKD